MKKYLVAVITDLDGRFLRLKKVSPDKQPKLADFEKLAEVHDVQDFVGCYVAAMVDNGGFYQELDILYDESPELVKERLTNYHYQNEWAARATLEIH
jgi:hypothetical protein